jgi:hypothetical protein
MGQMGTLEKANQKDLDDPLYLYKVKSDPMSKATLSIAQIIANNKARFSSPPIGPVASLLRITDPSWVKTVEALTYNLHQFVCANTQDQKTLETLVRAQSKDLANRLSYVVRDDKEFYSRALPAPHGMRAVIDIIDFEGVPPSVHNLLMDGGKFDKTLLVESDADHPRLTQQFTGLTRDFYKVTTFGSGRTYNVMNNNAPAPFIRGPKTADKAAQVAQLKQEIEQQRAAVKDLAVKLRAAEGFLSTANKQVDIESRQMLERKRKMNAANQAYAAALRLPEDVEDGAEDKDQEEVYAAEADLSRVQEQQVKAQGRLKELVQKQAPLRAELERVEAAYSALVNDPALKNSIAHAMTQIAAANEAEKKAVDMLARAVSQKEGILNDLNKADAEVRGREERQEQVYAAAKAGSEPGVGEQAKEFKGKTVKELSAIQEELKVKLAAESKRYGGDGDTDIFAKAKEAYQRALADEAEGKTRLNDREGTAEELSKQYKESTKRFHLNKAKYCEVRSTQCCLHSCSH